ncbi:MAG TPA: hypothetical protein VHR43_07830 [Gemmatimonadales bacterium]|jgi:hypothetical protein|nr:hypothetical protein [Gemmatimonadales bacterium]
MEFARIALLATITAALAACGGGPRDQSESAAVDTAARAADSAAKAARSGAQRVANVMIGKRLGAGNRIAEPTFQFAAQDTVFVAGEIQGAPKEGSLTARWLAQGGKVIDSTTQPISASDTGYKEFHLPAPAKGWQPGTYLVTLYLNGDSAEAKTFAVRK